jgi:hypothetical protein
MKRLFILLPLFTLCVAVVFALAQTPDTQSGESTMRQPDNLTAMDTLEKFNDPANFFATRKNFDIAAFKKNADSFSDYNFVREDGVHVRQIDFDENGYKEEFTRPDSHYRYSTMYTPSGKLKAMAADFCRNYVREIVYFDEKGKIVERKNKEGQFLPIEKLRAQFLEKTKIDIYDTEMVILVRRPEYDGKKYYDIYVRKEPGSPYLTAYLLDALTGEILFLADAIRARGIGPSAYVGYKEHLQSIGKKP